MSRFRNREKTGNLDRITDYLRSRFARNVPQKNPSPEPAKSYFELEKQYLDPTTGRGDQWQQRQDQWSNPGYGTVDNPINYTISDQPVQFSLKEVLSPIPSFYKGPRIFGTVTASDCEWTEHYINTAETKKTKEQHSSLPTKF